MGWEVRRPVWFEYSGLMLFLSSLIYIFKECYFKQENSVIVSLIYYMLYGSCIFSKYVLFIISL